MSDNYTSFLKEIASALDTGLEMVAGRKVGFCLLVFPFDSDESRKLQEVGQLGGDYVSNADRDDMIRMLRETADRLEHNKDIQQPIGSA